MGLLLSALGGAADAGQKMLEDKMKSEDLSARDEQHAKLQADLDVKRQATIEAMKAARDDTARTNQVNTINGQLSLNADGALTQRYAGDDTLNPEQQRQQRVAKEREKMDFMRDPRNRVQAAVETGYETPAVLLNNDAKYAKLAGDVEVRSAMAEAKNAKTAADQQIALAKLEATLASASQSKPPAGYRALPNGNMQAIPGGPADMKQQGALNADTAQLTGSISSFDRLGTAANAVLNHPGLAGITGLRGSLPNMPGGDAADAQALLGTLKSQVGFGVLQDMRNNSKTGGALGSVSDAEGKRLEANLAALEKSQSLEQFQASLRQIVDYSETAKDRVREAFNLRHGDKAVTGSPGAAPRAMTPADIAHLPSGATFTAPDGSIRRKP